MKRLSRTTLILLMAVAAGASCAPKVAATETPSTLQESVPIIRDADMHRLGASFNRGGEES